MKINNILITLSDSMEVYLVFVINNERLTVHLTNNSEKQVNFNI